MTTKRWILTLSITFCATAGLAVADADAADPALKNLMKKMGAAQAGGDAKALAPLLAQAKGAGKPEYTEWTALADQGERAAAAGDMAGAKASCKGCHDKYKHDYKAKYGSKAP
jgi:hypothetical protein